MACVASYAPNDQEKQSVRLTSILFSGNNVPGWTDLELVDREQLSGPCSIEAAAVQDPQ